MAIGFAIGVGSGDLLRAFRSGHECRGLVFFPARATTPLGRAPGVTIHGTPFKVAVIHPLERVRATVCMSVCRFQAYQLARAAEKKREREELPSRCLNTVIG